HQDDIDTERIQQLVRIEYGVFRRSRGEEAAEPDGPTLATQARHFMAECDFQWPSTLDVDRFDPLPRCVIEALQRFDQQIRSLVWMPTSQIEQAIGWRLPGRRKPTATDAAAARQELDGPAADGPGVLGQADAIGETILRIAQDTPEIPPHQRNLSQSPNVASERPYRIRNAIRCRRPPGPVTGGKCPQRKDMGGWRNRQGAGNRVVSGCEHSPDRRKILQPPRL